jgi:hypothetical protein
MCHVGRLLPCWAAVARPRSVAAKLRGTIATWTVCKMNAGVAVVDRADLIKWYDALDALTLLVVPRHIVTGLQMARECQHPDAMWLASLFPPGVEATQQRMREVMLQQGSDPRASYFVWTFGERDEGVLLSRAAQRGYAPAQVALAAVTKVEAERLPLHKKAAGQNDRNALFHLGRLSQRQEDCGEKVIELIRRAAELNHQRAQVDYGHAAFGAAAWERYFWWSQAAEDGYGSYDLCVGAAQLLPSFECGECGRILSTAAPVMRNNREKWRTGQETFREAINRDHYTVSQLERVFELHAAMLGRTRSAIDCWSMAGWRCGVMKDMRVMIAKMLWEETWRWGEKEKARDDKEETECA